jgi:hypothetical protein
MRNKPKSNTERRPPIEPQRRGRPLTLKPENKGFIPQAFKARYHNQTDTQKYHRMGAMVKEYSYCHALF